VSESRDGLLYAGLGSGVATAEEVAFLPGFMYYVVSDSLASVDIIAISNKTNETSMGHLSVASISSSACFKQPTVDNFCQ
jgi:hypothetical protein